MRDRLQADLDAAVAELREHMASWAYAFAMAGGANGGRDHPMHRATRERTVALEQRCGDLRARLAEYDV
jgi:hypothetical protein